MAEFNNPRNNSNRREQAPAEPKQYEEVVLNVDRVSRVVKGGRRFRFKALVAVGDGKTKIGVGVAKGADVQAAVAKATNVAKKHIVVIAVSNGTIAHEAEVKFTGAHVLLKPAAPGTGIIAGGVVRTIIGLTGIRDLMTKSLGSTNKVNIAYAVVKALESIVPKSQWLNVKKTKKVAQTPEITAEVSVEAPAVVEKPKKAVSKKAPAKKVTKETK
jgi:small subunit ribosomal protein S5